MFLNNLKYEALDYLTMPFKIVSLQPCSYVIHVSVVRQSMPKLITHNGLLGILDMFDYF